MSAKPTAKKTRFHHYSFKLPDGLFVGRVGFHQPLAPQHVAHAIWYSAEGIAAKRAEVLAQFPTAKVVPTPRWSEESEEYETPVGVPFLN